MKEQTFLKAKQCLEKVFCFTQIQADDAKRRGDKIMEIEDIKYLLSLQGLDRKDFFFMDKLLNTSAFLHILKQAKENGFHAVILYDEFSDRIRLLLEQYGYFVEYIGFGSISWRVILLSEEALIKYKIQDFQHALGGFRSVYPLLKGVM